MFIYRKNKFSFLFLFYVSGEWILLKITRSLIINDTVISIFFLSDKTIFIRYNEFKVVPKILVYRNIFLL